MKYNGNGVGQAVALSAVKAEREESPGSIGRDAR